MPKKQRAFFDPERDKKIAELGPKFNRADLGAVNHTEFVQLCQLLNPDGGAHLGMDRATLDDIILGVVPDDAGNPIDRVRRKLCRFIEANWEKINDQFDPSCTGNCFQCHDFMVLGCYVANADHLKNSPEEG